MAEHKVCKVSDIADGQCQAFEIEGARIAVFNVGGKFWATDDTCKHRGGSLGTGQLDGNIVTCPLHKWQYDVTTGACETNPQEKLDTVPVKVEDDQLVVTV